MVPMQFLSLVLGGSTDSSVAEPNLRCFLGGRPQGRLLGQR